MAKRYLEIGPDFKLPAVEASTQSIVIYGNRGMGKTNLAAVLAEEFVHAGIRFSLLDPVGVSWGLRHSADGKGKGINLLILGGRHGDLPIEPTGGAVVADLVVDEEVDTLIDISGNPDGRRWSHNAKIRFAADYLERLLERQGERKRPIMQMLDEAARFAPQMIERKDDQIVRCKGALDTIVEEGRNSAIGLTLITQRSARMAKSVSELAELMIAFRTTGPNSIGAILDWFGEHIPKDRWNELLEIVRKLPVGQALAVSPGWLEIEDRVQIRKRTTFDSSKTPTGTEEKLARSHRRPDLEKYREQLAATVERAEASDPSKLRAKVTAAERAAEKTRLELEKAQQQIEELKARKVGGREKPAAPALTDADRELLANLRHRLDLVAMDVTGAPASFLQDLEQTLARGLEKFGKAYGAEFEHRRKEFLELLDRAKFQAILGKLEAAAAASSRSASSSSATMPTRAPSPASRPPAPRASQPAPPPRPITLDGESRILTADGTLKKHARALLATLAQHGKPLTREQLHILAGYQPSGDTSVAISEMLGREWIETVTGGALAIVDAGLKALGPFDPLPTGEALRAELLDGNRLSRAEKKLLGALFAEYPGILSRAELHEKAGMKPSGDTSVAISKFKKLGWADERDRFLVAASTFFE